MIDKSPLITWTLAILFLASTTHGFTTGLTTTKPYGCRPSTSFLDAKKKKKSNSNSRPDAAGFGAGMDKVDRSKINVVKTYESRLQKPIPDLIDAEAAMINFFKSNEDWHPLFRSLISSSDNEEDLPAFSFLDPHEGELQFGSEVPWKILEPIPEDEHKPTLALVLDSSQQALVDIPVTEGLEQDDNDLHFLEEGRRILALSRFQVLSGDADISSTIDKHDELFSTCWSEIHSLASEGQPDTGSLIILPETYDMSDLRRFTDMNILRPLEWLGLGNDFEVTSLQRENPCIRLIHQLSGMRDLADKPPGPE